MKAELNNLNYARKDPIIWTANVRGLIERLTAKTVDRQVRNAVLKALAIEPEYKVRIEVIRQTQPNISLDDLWLTVVRLPYPLENNERAFAAMKLISNAKKYQKEKGQEKKCKGREPNSTPYFCNLLPCNKSQLTLEFPTNTLSLITHTLLLFILTG